MSTSDTPETPKTPVCLLVLGMAGSGKTSLATRLADGHEGKKPYVVNLDPACINLPYFANIDIRDTVNYKEVMKQYKLGPNGAIVTSLNLFSTKFPEVIDFIGKSGQEHCVLDTPGQIEVFAWSVSGNINFSLKVFLLTNYCGLTRIYNYGNSGFHLPNCDSICGWLCAQHFTSYFYVKHVICLLYSLQNPAALHSMYE